MADLYKLKVSMHRTYYFQSEHDVTRFKIQVAEADAEQVTYSQFLEETSQRLCASCGKLLEHHTARYLDGDLAGVAASPLDGHIFMPIHKAG